MKNVQFQTILFVSIFLLIPLLTACGNNFSRVLTSAPDSTTGQELATAPTETLTAQDPILQAAEEAVQAWSTQNRSPIQDANYSIYEQDDTFGVVVVRFDVRNTMASDWQGKTVWISCQRYGEQWGCDQDMNKQSHAELVHASATAYEIVESKGTSLACRRRPPGTMLRFTWNFTSIGISDGETEFERESENYYVHKYKTYPNYQNESRIQLYDDGSFEYVNVGELYQGDSNMYLCTKYRAVMR